MIRPGQVVGGVLALAATLIVAVPGAVGASLYSGSGPRPGPAVLYAPAADAPQLQNTGVWGAPPILVSGASAYRRGEFLYQDFLYDDHGATEAPDPADPRSAGNAFSKPNGTYTYPTDPAYAGDAADLVELRVKPLAGATAFRVTLNSMRDPKLVAFSVAIGGTPGVSLPFPDGANVRAPADLFLTVHPGASGAMVGDLVHAATGTAVGGPAPTVSVDAGRRQIHVLVPHSAWNPSGQVVRLAAGVGLWDRAGGRYLLPGAAADSTHPGGAGSAAAPPAFFNVAFRFDEPMPTIGDVFNDLASAAWWRDKAQGAALAAGDISGFHADVDFRKLAAGSNDDMSGQPGGVPASGPMDRILASRFETAQGTDFGASCTTAGAATCKGEYQGQLQPYAIYVPSKPQPAQGYGLTLLLHALATNYNLFLGSRNQSQLGERGPGSIVVTPEARGPDGSYTSYAGADVFEVWADVARHYRLDPAWSAISGYSMGAIGTFKLAEQFPDLFARAQSTSGADQNGMLASLRNVPTLMWNMVADEEVPFAEALQTATTLDQLGYRYELDAFTPGEHNTFAVYDQYGPAAAFLGTARVDREPAHVTFMVDPTLDYPNLGFVADHAYWVSGVRIRNNVAPAGGGDAMGTVDVFSHGFGSGDPGPSGTQHGSGTLSGGNLPPTPLVYSRQFQDWGAPTPGPLSDELDIHAQNVRSVAIDAPRARVSCAADLKIASDGPLAVTLTGCESTLGLPSARACVDTRRFSFRLHHAARARIVRVEVFVNGKRKLRLKGRNLTRITLKRLPRKRFTVRIVATRNTGSQLISTRVYRGCTKSRPRTRAHHRRSS